MQLSRNYTSAAAFLKQLEKSEDKRQHCAKKGDIKFQDMLLPVHSYSGGPC